MDPARECLSRASLLIPDNDSPLWKAAGTAFEGSAKFSLLMEDLSDLIQETGHGYTPDLEDRYSELWELSDRLESDIASFKDYASHLFTAPEF